MRIKSFAIENYKSFRSQEPISFGAGFNVIVGENNVGKTALVEALGCRFGPGYGHRSQITAPRPGMAVDELSRARVEFELSPEEMAEVLISAGVTQIYVPVTQDARLEGPKFDAAVRETITLVGEYTGGRVIFESCGWRELRG